MMEQPCIHEILLSPSFSAVSKIRDYQPTIGAIVLCFIIRLVRGGGWGNGSGVGWSRRWCSSW